MKQEDTKQRILDKALELFSAKGYDSVSVGEIAKAVGIKAPSLYNHFPSKQAIFDAIVESTAVQYEADTDKIDIHVQDARKDIPIFTETTEDALFEKVRQIFEYSLHNETISRFRRMMTIEQFRSSELAVLYSNRYVERILHYHAGIFRALIASGEISAEDPDTLAMMYVAPVLTLIGIIGAIYWLVYAKKPVVDLHCMKDRNFAISSLLMAGMAMILYGSSVVIPQLAQQDLGYTATWSGLVLSPGAVLIVLTIPLVLKLMPVVQTRWIIAFGFTCLAVSFFWSRTLTPDIDFETLVLFRSAQSIGLGFLFVPLTTIAFISIPRRLNADAAALFTMFRNVAGSIGISLSTAAITERSQAHSAHLAYHASPFNEQFQLAIRESAQAIQNFTTQVGDPTGIATGRMYQTMIEQSRFLAYIDVFTILSVVAMLLIPFCLLLSPVKSEGSAGAH